MSVKKSPLVSCA